MANKSQIFSEFQAGKRPSDLKGKYPVDDTTLYKYFQEWKNKAGQATSQITLAQPVKQSQDNEMAEIIRLIDKGDPAEKIVIKTGYSPDKVVEGFERYKELKLRDKDLEEIKLALEFLREAKQRGYSAKQICEAYKNVKEVLEHSAGVRSEWEREIDRLRNEKNSLIRECNGLQSRIDGMELKFLGYSEVHIEYTKYLMALYGKILERETLLKKVDPQVAEELKVELSKMLPIAQCFHANARAK